MAEPLVINSATPIGSGRFYYKLDTNQGEYYYTPFEFANKGLLQGETQFFDQGFLRNPDILKQATPIRIESGLAPNLERAGYENATNGLLLNKDQAKYLLGGKETFSDWGNVTNAGYVDLYNINEINPNSGTQFGAITGLGEFQGTPVYIRPTEAGKTYSYVIPSDQFATGTSLRNTTVTVEKKGGVLGDIARGIGNLFSSIPVVGDIAAFALGGPVLLGISKGGQVASAGGSPMDAFKSGAISGGLIGAGQALATQAPAPIYTATPVPAADVLAGAATPSAVPSLAPSLLGGAAELASVGATGSSLTGPITSLGGPAELATVGATMPTVPSAFDTAVSTGLGQTPQIGQFGPTGTAGFGTALAPAAEVAAGLEAAGFAPGTAANLAGLTAAGTGATGLLGGATAIPAAAASTISVQDALRGARLVNSLLTPQQPQTPNMLNRAQEALKTQGGVDYTSLLSLLSQRASTPGLLGTRFQPQSINLASLLG